MTQALYAHMNNKRKIKKKKKSQNESLPYNYCKLISKKEENNRQKKTKPHKT
jgi:hypothetical protein